MDEYFDLVYRLRKRAEIRRGITTRKSVQNNEPDRIADLLDEAAQELVDCEMVITDYRRKLRDRDMAMEMFEQECDRLYRIIELNGEAADRLEMLEQECSALRQQLRQMESQVYGGVSQ